MSKWYRKEIAPGIPMIPNMARPPLHPYTPKASFFGWFTREQTNTRSSARDNSVSSSCSSAVKVSWYRRLVTTVVTAVTTIWVTVTSVTHITAGRTHNVNGIHTQRLKGRQLFQESNTWWRLPFVWLYRLMMNILAVDIGILAAVRRSANKLRSSRTGVELVTILLLLLPLILFFGFYRDQFPHHKSLLVDTVESSRSWISSSLSGIFGLIPSSLSNIFGSGYEMISSSLSGVIGWISSSFSNIFGSGYELISSSLFGIIGWISATLYNTFGSGYELISSSLSGILGWISASLSSIYGRGSGMFSSVCSYWSQSQRSCEAGYFDMLIDSISSGLVTVGQSAWQFMLYLYSFLLLLPTLLPSPLHGNHCNWFCCQDGGH
ncbi:uncharacterized protein LOC120352774 [Nilaparvata lugens]|uniref:uncharacterized protein LOC120352774 n=1 Tax=Nilaparvata lugens TaxID=108931 RepID=UPI00193CF106|nr:uncharacterized protein LOC120352774 [Nilaparvata lugens]